MSDLSKRALASALMDMLRVKSFEKITVLELTNRCGITRNAFYYHFHDIYDLLQYVFETEIETLKEQYYENKNWEGGLEQGLVYIYNHKSALKNLYQPINQELVIKYINNVAQEHARAVIGSTVEERKLTADSKSMDIVAKFYKDALIGAITAWMVSDMDTDPVKLARYFDVMFSGTFDSTVESAHRAGEFIR